MIADCLQLQVFLLAIAGIFVCNADILPAIAGIFACICEYFYRKVNVYYRSVPILVRFLGFRDSKFLRNSSYQMLSLFRSSRVKYQSISMGPFSTNR